MRLATLRTGDGSGDGTVAAVTAGDEWVLLPYRDTGAVLTDPGGLSTARAAAGDGPRDTARPPLAPGVTLGPVVPHPSKIVCCGHNYAGHIREMGRGLPRHPTLFTKFADTLTGATDTVTVPCWAERLDWEAELAVVVGKPVHRASRPEAAAAIAGYTAANDLSVRAWQQHTGQWLPGKAFDATTPLGPVLVTADELDPADGLELTCRVNGVTVQHASTADLVFDAAALVAYISAFTRLSPGDVVLTGTPAGVGAALTPPRFLADGDVVEVELAGIGALTTVIRIEHPGPRVPPTWRRLHMAEQATDTTELDLVAVPVVTRAGSEDRGTGQSGGAVRISGVSPQHTPATRIWYGKVSNEPGYRSLPHHHGEAETGGYVLSGTGRIWYGENYAQWLELTEGDFVFVPPYMPHVEGNMSTTSELVWLTCRTPDNIVVNLPEVDDAILEGYRRA